jgi:hypothetical protein
MDTISSTVNGYFRESLLIGITGIGSEREEVGPFSLSILSEGGERASWDHSRHQ